MPAPPGDHYFQSDIATIIIRESSRDRPWWLATWLPNDETHPFYPGFTQPSSELPFPTDQGPLAAAEWIDRWARERAAGRVPEEVLDVRAETVHDAAVDEAREEAEKRHADAGWETEISRTVDGRWAWRTHKEGTTIATGVADDYDGAKLDSIVGFPPPHLDQ